MALKASRYSVDLTQIHALLRELLGKVQVEQQAAAIDEGLRLAGPRTVDDDLLPRAVACEIVEHIAAGHWTAGAVVRAYIRRAALVHARHNCLTEVRFAAAIDEADRLDEEFLATGKLAGRLHGVPLSVKEQFHLTGFDTSNGYTSWTNKPQDKDGGLVQIARSEGAIVIAKTKVPQALLILESTNPLFGRTSNPWNAVHTCGGSSGGEAALLAADGAALGLGTDYGGSLRIPTSYCGIYSLKPTSGRVTSAGIGITCPGFDSMSTLCGPMGRSVRDVDLVARIAFGRPALAYPSEYLAPVPYREFPAPEKPRLKLGYYTFDGCIRTSPAAARAVFETVAAMRAAGHEAVEFVPPEVHDAIAVFAGISSAEGYESIQKPIGHDPTEKELFLMTLGPKLPAFLRWLLGWVVAKLSGDKYFLADMVNSRKKNAQELFRLHAARDDFIKMWHEEVWERHGFDAIIAPVQAIPAPPHGGTTRVPQISLSTFMYNVLDVPVGVVPSTRVDAATDAATQDGPHGGMALVERELYDGRAPLYDAERMHGLPVGVQIVGRRWEDEKVLYVMGIVDRALGERKFGPGTWAE